MDALNPEVLKDILIEAKVLLIPAKFEALIPNVAQVYLPTAEFPADLGSGWDRPLFMTSN